MTQQAVVIDSPEGIARYQMLVIRQGLKAIKQGFRVNTQYTPKNLRLATEQITGKKFKARDYDGMIAALTEKIDA